MTIVRAVVVVVVVQSLVMQNVLLDVLQTMITSHFSSPVKKSVVYIKKERKLILRIFFSGSLRSTCQQETIRLLLQEQKVSLVLPSQGPVVSNPQEQFRHYREKLAKFRKSYIRGYPVFELCFYGRLDLSHEATNNAKFVVAGKQRLLALFVDFIYLEP